MWFWFPLKSLTVSGSRSVSGQVPPQPGLPRRPGQTGRHGHRHPGGVPQTGDGGGEEDTKLLTVIIIIIIIILLFLCFQAPESYKNVTDVVNTCHEAGISKKAIKLRPIAVIKG